MKSGSSTPNQLREIYGDQIAVLEMQGQRRLSQSRVHVAGLGGIGAQVALHLVTAGVGHVTANDPQQLELSNLCRWPLGKISDVDKPKVNVLRDFLAYRPGVRFDAAQECSESTAAASLMRAADLIVCCSNTIPSKAAAVDAAISSGRPLIDVGVADGRRALVGAIRLFNPRYPRYACPACLLPMAPNISRNEGLLSTVIASAAAFATHVAVMLLSIDSTPDPESLGNLFVFDFEKIQIERFRVRRRPDCRVCK